MITVQIASIPDRVNMLEKTVASLRDQCDRIWVGLNNYDKPPKFLGEGEYGMFDNSMGDAVKFYDVENLEGWILTCDDDLIYPDGYVEMMMRKCYEHNAAVTLHGKDYPRPVVAFHKPMSVYRCLGSVVKDVKVDVGGTGVMCYHTNLLKLRYDDFKLPNMADLWFAKVCKEQGVPIWCIRHDEGYLEYQSPHDTIYDSFRPVKFAPQTKVLKSFL